MPLPFSIKSVIETVYAHTEFIAGFLSLNRLLPVFLYLSRYSECMQSHFPILHYRKIISTSIRSIKPNQGL